MASKEIKISSSTADADKKKESLGILSGVITSNYATKTAYYRPEEGSTAEVLDTGWYWFNQPCDGVATQKYKDRVFKVPDLSAFHIDENGEVLPSLGGMFFGDYGWKDKSWLDSLHAMNDTKWDKLFDAAARI